MSFKRLTRHIVVGTVLAMATGGAWAGIANTKHNLGSTGTGANHSGSATLPDGTDEICVFCHTPHGANASGGAPLWNKNLPGTTYTTYATTSTLDSSVLAVGSVSIACLSCHDGTQAMNSMINEPGSGLDTITAAAGSWNPWTGVQTVDGIANLGADLSNDHPIGVAYAGGGCGGLAATSCDPATQTRDKDFNAATQTSATSDQWFVESAGSPAGRDKTDMILYARDFTSDSLDANEPSVECGSCHDPHTESSLFLRRTGGNSQSQVCLSCHTK